MCKLVYVFYSLSQGKRLDAVNCQWCSVTISQLQLQLQPPTTQLLARHNSFQLLSAAMPPTHCRTPPFPLIDNI